MDYSQTGFPRTPMFSTMRVDVLGPLFKAQVLLSGSESIKLQ